MCCCHQSHLHEFSLNSSLNCECHHQNHDVDKSRDNLLNFDHLLINHSVYWYFRVKLNVPFNFRVEVFIGVLWAKIFISKKVIHTLKSMGSGQSTPILFWRTCFLIFYFLSCVIMDREHHPHVFIEGGWYRKLAPQLNDKRLFK